MKNVWLAVIVVLIIILFLIGKSSSSSNYSYIENIDLGFKSLCPPGQIPASYTAEGGDCVPYYF